MSIAAAVVCDGACMVRVCQLRRHTHRSAILGIHGLKKRPVVVDGAVVVRPMCYVGLTYDHRCVLVQPAKGPGAPPPCCPTHLRTRKRDCPVRRRKQVFVLRRVLRAATFPSVTFPSVGTRSASVRPVPALCAVWWSSVRRWRSYCTSRRASRTRADCCWSIR